MYTLEVCVDSIESALAAADAGSDRIELASCLDLGGLTPSHALIQQVCRKINTCKIHVLVRPRGGDFLYSKEEIDVVTADVVTIAGLGAHGVVLGFLNPNSTIDSHLTTKFVDLCAALDLDFTFHRAFDVVSDQSIALETLIDCGVRRVLTSGGNPKAFHALDKLSSLVKQAEGRISIMPGSGVDENNALAILKVTGATEIHGSFRKTLQSRMEFLHPRVHFNSTVPPEKSRNAGGGSSGNGGPGNEEAENEEDSEDRVEYSREQLAEFWSQSVADEEKIRKVKEQLLSAGGGAEEEEREMD